MSAGYLRRIAGLIEVGLEKCNGVQFSEDGFRALKEARALTEMLLRDGDTIESCPRFSALQDWVMRLPVMQQSVLIAAVRGPDGIRKDHVVKVLCRWLRRSFLVRAFERDECWNPYTPGGGSFTGPCVIAEGAMGGVDQALDEYLRCVDELPHHFQLHFMHAAEIIGYEHPDEFTRTWWHNAYFRLVNDAHLFMEPREQMNKRLGDNEGNWREREEVTAK